MHGAPRRTLSLATPLASLHLHPLPHAAEPHLCAYMRTHVHMHVHTPQQVGRKPSSASAYLGDHSDVVELLKMLASLSATKRKTHASAGDLTKVEVSFGGPHGGQGVQGLGGKAGLGRSSDALPRAL